MRGYDRHAVDSYVERVNGVIAELQISGSPPAAVRHALDRVGEQTSGILQHARETAEEITASARHEAEDTTARAKAEARDITADAQQRARDAISRASADADQLLTAARAEAEEILARASEQSETTSAQARLETEQQARQVEQEIASEREDAEARLRSLQADVAAISDERHTLLEDVRQIAARLEAIAADAEPIESQTPPEPHATVTDDTMPPDGPNGAEADDQQSQTTTPSRET
jgi:vacuolar-type H+-ATPase subunit E/Vma4